VVAFVAIVSLPTNPWPFVHFLHLNFGFALPVACLIFCVARYRNAITTVLSHRTMVCGDASYSLYLLHLPVIAGVDLAVYEIGSSALLTSVVLFRLGAGLLAAIGLSLITYRLVEVPTRRWLRQLMLIRVETMQANSAPHVAR